MKPNVRELNLTSDEHNALLADLERLASTGLLQQRANGGQHDAMNSGAVSVFLGEVIGKHLPQEVREILAHAKDADVPPIIVIGNLPTTEAAEERHIRNAQAISPYLLRGLATLLEHDPGTPLAEAGRKDIEIDKVAAKPGRPDRGVGYHRDALPILEARQSGRPYGPAPTQYSMLLCERENVHAATYFVDPDNPHIQYFQNVSADDEQPPVEARPVILRAGQLCLFRNNELLHGRIATTQIDPERARLLTSAIVESKPQKYASLPTRAPVAGSLEEEFTRAVEAGRREAGAVQGRG